MNTIGLFYGFCPTNKDMVGKVKDLLPSNFWKNKSQKSTLNVQNFLHISTFTVTYDNADIATLRQVKK